MRRIVHDAYAREENYLRTDGHDVCHWCSLRPQTWIWGPYGMRTCSFCDELLAAGDVAAVVDAAWARLRIGGMEGRMDLERWRARELDRVARFLEVRRESTVRGRFRPHGQRLPPLWRESELYNDI
jgi:hypothetical protein